MFDFSSIFYKVAKFSIKWSFSNFNSSTTCSWVCPCKSISPNLTRFRSKFVVQMFYKLEMTRLEVATNSYLVKADLSWPDIVKWLIKEMAARMRIINSEQILMLDMAAESKKWEDSMNFTKLFLFLNMFPRSKVSSWFYSPPSASSFYIFFNLFASSYSYSADSDSSSPRLNSSRS